MSNSDATRSLRIRKYREDLSDKGYERLDVPIPCEIKAKIKDLAQKHRVGTSQMASILLELALRESRPSGLNSSNADVAKIFRGVSAPVAASGMSVSFQSDGFVSLDDSIAGIKQTRERQLNKSMEVGVATSVRLGYQANLEKHTGDSVPADPVSAFFEKRKLE